MNTAQGNMADIVKAAYIPEPKHIQRFFEFSNKTAKASASANEMEWYNEMTNRALNGLA